MKKYVYPLTALVLLAAFAACFTWFGWGDEFFAALRPLGTPAPQTDDRVVMPPVRAPRGGINITVSPKVIDTEGMVRSALSGRWIPEDVALRRPFAVVIGNSDISLPQSGLTQAELIYEVISEGVTTRIIGIFQDFDTEKIGSVRSARHYFIDIALDYDAFFVHFGGSPQTFDALRSLRINNINGILLDGGVRTENFNQVVFWRDSERWRRSGLREHSAYTMAENLIRQANRAGYRMELNNPNMNPFNFYATAQSPQDAVPANRISVTFVSTTPVVFEYNAQTRRYYRFYGSNLNPQMDEETGLQMASENVIVQLTTVRAIPNDPEGRRDVAVVGSGTGYLFTNGTMVPLRWSKASSTAPTVWTFENGERLTLNIGQTWICITNREPVVE